MRKFLNSLLVALLVFTAVPVVVTGCANWKQSLHKSEGTVVITVETAMKAWAKWVAQGHATAAQETKVKGAYQKYQAAMLGVIDASKAATNSGDQTTLQTIIVAATAAQADVVNIIQSFLPEKIQPAK